MLNFIVYFGIGFFIAIVAYLIGKNVALSIAQREIDRISSRVTPLNCAATYHVFFGERSVCRCGNMSAGKLLAKARKHAR